MDGDADRELAARVNGRSMALVLLENGLGLDPDLSLIITPPRTGDARAAAAAKA